MSAPAMSEELDFTPPTLPPRSRLYHLEPIGIGTGGVECLTGYTARLAAVHSVSPVKLFDLAYVPRESQTPPGQNATSPPANYYKARFVTATQALNGTGAVAHYWVEALSALTLRRDLRQLTTLSWGQSVSRVGLHRRRRAWCQRCYQHWHEVHQEIYEPLCWTLEAVEVCPQHQRLLAHVCPHCGQGRLKLLGYYFRPGFCNHCGGWLGSGADDPSPALLPPESAEFAYKIWAAHNVGSLLAERQLLAPSCVAQVRQSIDRSVNQLTGGCESRFAQLLAVNLRTVQNWRTGKFSPGLKHLLQIAYLLKLSVSHFVAGQLENVRLCGDRCEATLNESPKPHPATGVRGAYPRRKIHDTATLAQALHAELEQEHPRSYQELAVSLGYQHYGAMYQQLPELCRALKNKRIAIKQQRLVKLEAMLKAALTEEPPPSMVALSRRCEGGRGGALRNNFPALCAAISARHMAYVKEEREKVPARLAAALMEEPPQTMIEVGTRLGYGQSMLRKKYSPLCQAIAARYKAYRKEQSERKKQALMEEVRQVVRELDGSGTYPSWRKVWARLQPTTGKCFWDCKVAHQEAKRELGYER